jgi:hypothetical protein
MLNFATGRVSFSGCVSFYFESTFLKDLSVLTKLHPRLYCMNGIFLRLMRLHIELLNCVLPGAFSKIYLLFTFFILATDALGRAGSLHSVHI